MKIPAPSKEVRLREEHGLFGALGLIAVVHLIGCPLLIAHFGIGDAESNFLGNGALGVLCVLGGTALLTLTAFAIDQVSRKKEKTA